MVAWYKNKWGWLGIGIIMILNFIGFLSVFNLITAFGSLFLIGTFPIWFVILVPQLIIGYFLGRLLEVIWRKLRYFLI